MAVAKRTPEEIRASMEANREGLSTALTSLKDEVTELTDWRKQVRDHKKELIVGTVVLGVAMGLGLGLSRLFRGSD
jgi:hypothetical protein